jgi:hypothetical protein
MLVTEKQYVEVRRGVDLDTRISEVLCTDEKVVKHVGDVISRFLAGRQKPIRVRGNGPRGKDGHGTLGVAITRKYVHTVIGRDPENPRRRSVQSREEIKAGLEHVLTAKIETRDDLGRTVDHDTMKPIEPYLHVVFKDGSQVDLPLDSSKKTAEAGEGTE